MAQVTVLEAADRLKVSTQTIKRRLKNGSLQGEQQATPQGYIWLVDIPDSNVDTTNRVCDISTDVPLDISKEVKRLEEIITILQKELDYRDHQLETKDSQIEARAREVQELHVLLQQSQTALPAPRENRQSWWRFWRQ